MKQCTKCHKHSDESNFYTGSGKTMTLCKQCMNDYAKGWQRRNKTKKAAYNARWRRVNDDKIRVMKAASNAVMNGLKVGTMIRPATCSACLAPASKIEAAHSDYSKPLHVRWLCVSCHRFWDSNEAKCKGDEIVLPPKVKRSCRRKGVPLVKAAIKRTRP